MMSFRSFKLDKRVLINLSAANILIPRPCQQRVFDLLAQERRVNRRPVMVSGPAHVGKTFCCLLAIAKLHSVTDAKVPQFLVISPSPLAALRCVADFRKLTTGTDIKHHAMISLDDQSGLSIPPTINVLFTTISSWNRLPRNQRDSWLPQLKMVLMHDADVAMTNFNLPQVFGDFLMNKPTLDRPFVVVTSSGIGCASLLDKMMLRKFNADHIECPKMTIKNENIQIIQTAKTDEPLTMHTRELVNLLREDILTGRVLILCESSKKTSAIHKALKAELSTQPLLAQKYNLLHISHNLDIPRKIRLVSTFAGDAKYFDPDSHTEPHVKLALKEATQGLQEELLQSKSQILVCTDLALHGLHISDIDTVISVDLPQLDSTLGNRKARAASSDSKYLEFK